MGIRLVLTPFLAILLTGCLGEEAPKSSKNSGPKESCNYNIADVQISGDINAYQWVDLDVNASIVLGNLPAGTYNYTFTQNKPSWLSINSSTGQLTGTPTDLGNHPLVGIRATRQSDSETFDEIVTVAVHGDPIREHQWALNNTGQTSFAINNGTVGIDVNVGPVYAAGITGEGVSVAVSDTGVDINHDDLCQNVLSGKSKNYTKSSPYFGYPVPADPYAPGHGTQVAGLIGATGWNNLGITGVAPASSIAGFQFLSSSASTKILIDQASGVYDIFNYSYGDFAPYDRTSDQDYIDHIRSQVINGRSGKGKIYVKAAGNEYLMTNDPNVDDHFFCTSHNANAPLENESYYMIIVGAINADGTKASYSSAGSNLWVVAPGGEFGVIDPALLTTDLQGCFQGLSKASAASENDFEYDNSLNPRCDFTSRMNGTSGATPIVSGVIALILDANPNLSWRDVKHILAKTAVQVDAGNNDVDNINSDFTTFHPSLTADAIHSFYLNCDDLSLASHTYEQGWVTNGAGYKFHNIYGFGLVDAGAAVALAQNTASDPWLPMPPMVELNREFTSGTYKRVPNAAIPDNSAAGVSDSMTVSQGSITNVESVQVKIYATHGYSIGELGFELTSPSGTKSIIMNINNSFLLDTDGVLNMVFTSHAFYGETPNGTWTLKAIDGDGSKHVSGVSGDTGVLQTWSLNIMGH
jgi:subtilisin family serine protease